MRTGTCLQEAHVDPSARSRLYRLLSERLVEPLRQADDDGAAPGEDTVGYLKAAERALNTGELGVAEKYASRVLSVAPDTQVRWHAEARSLLGNLAYERGRFEQAEEEYLEAAKLFEVISDKKGGGTPARGHQPDPFRSRARRESIEATERGAEPCYA